MSQNILKYFYCQYYEKYFGLLLIHDIDILDKIQASQKWCFIELNSKNAKNYFSLIFVFLMFNVL